MVHVKYIPHKVATALGINIVIMFSNELILYVCVLVCLVSFNNVLVWRNMLFTSIVNRKAICKLRSCNLQPTFTSI